MSRQRSQRYARNSHLERCTTLKASSSDWYLVFFRQMPSLVRMRVLYHIGASTPCGTPRLEVRVARAAPRRCVESWQKPHPIPSYHAVGRLSIHQPPMIPTATGKSRIGKGRSSSPAVALATNANTAADLPRLLIAPCSRQAVMCGCIAGCSTMRRSSDGLLRAKQNAARIMNGTVGSNGRITPTAPNASERSPIKK